jgi:aspartyl-tRNA(Asn)/glutamyl-tRNA(Gln) amidotransferase subunit B
MKTYYPTIGLEIHAELKTKTKMFCDSKNDPDEKRPNVNVCPVCMGHPGTLPVINKEAVRHVLKVGLALHGELADFTEFDRKNYFYPDIPKGYQISQYKYPLVSGGELKGVKITRVHLEEDTGKNTHEIENYSLVDYNRAGVPLMELVTEPVIHSAEEAVAFAKELQLTLQYLGVAEANMEKGEMRVEANISVSSDKEKFGTKVEVKNLNSFKAVEKAIRYELDRHIEVLENGEKIIQETRGWDEKKETTFSQRQKEESHDYRYFPDPDLPKLYITEIPEFAKNNLQKEIGELPDAKRERYKKDFGLKENDIEIFIQNASWGRYFEAVLKHLNNNVKLIQLASNYITSDLWGMVYGDVEFNKDRIPSEATFAELIKMIGDSKITSRGAKDTLAIMYKEGGSPEVIALKHGFIQKNDEGELKEIVEKIVAGNPKVVEDFKAGKAAALQFLIGQGMKETKGSANPEILKRIFTEVLG